MQSFWDSLTPGWEFCLEETVHGRLVSLSPLYLLAFICLFVYYPKESIQKGQPKSLKNYQSWILIWQPREIAMIDIFRHDFVQNAFLAGVIVAIISGFVGYVVVLRGQAFACEALSHVGFAGAVGAALAGSTGAWAPGPGAAAGAGTGGVNVGTTICGGAGGAGGGADITL